MKRLTILSVLVLLAAAVPLDGAAAASAVPVTLYYDDIQVSRPRRPAVTSTCRPALALRLDTAKWAACDWSFKALPMEAQSPSKISR